MNKAFCRIRNISSLFFTGCLILFNLSCGLDTFYVIDPPVNIIHEPVLSIDYTDNYFDFYTNNYIDPELKKVKLLGTEVYYKIYKSSTRLNSEKNDLISIANKSDLSTSAAERMIQSYKFQPLRASGHEGDSVLIPQIESNQRIVIRLSTYTVYPAKITISWEENNEVITNELGVPVRNLPTKSTFNFRASDYDSIPKSEDVDVNTSGSSSDSLWYISMFAVRRGLDENLIPVFSNILYLGSVQIPVE